MKTLVVLSSDTPHHRYFLNRLYDHGYRFAHVFFETEHIEPKFPVGPLFEKDEAIFEAENFFQEVSSDISHFEITEVKNLNSPDSIALLRGLNADLGIVFGTRKLQTAVIDCFQDGLFNVHRGIAEVYRGLDSDLWAIYHGDYQNIGVTIHMVEAQLDTGHIVRQGSMSIKSQMKIHQIRYYTTIIATKMIEEALHDYCLERLKTTPQKALGRYYSFMPLDLKKPVMKKFNKYCANR
jgi:methionyl-tRNA formyltransferase